MKIYKVGSDEQLFERWKSLRATISLLGNIIQNDGEASIDEIEEWKLLVDKVGHELQELAYDTHSHVTREVI